MIKETDVCGVITNEIPKMAIDLSMLKDPNSICQAMACFADYTKDLIRDHNIDEAVQCFYTAHNLLVDGSASVKNTVINIYVSSLSRLIDYTQTVEDNVRMQFLALFGREYFGLIYAHNP